MFGLGFTEILVLGLIAFLVFGPQQFPVVVKNFIKFFNELRQTFTDVKTEFYDVETEVKKQIHHITDDMNKEWESIKDFQLDEENSLEQESSQKRDETSHLEKLDHLKQKKEKELKKDSLD